MTIAMMVRFRKAKLQTKGDVRRSSSSSQSKIREFAEAVLFETDMRRKLHAPASFTDDKPGPSVAAPSAPGRPRFVPLRTSKVIPPAPTPSGIEEERNRGLALHSFAHHELQALELMALALLRFPDAPSGFRRGLVKILIDEIVLTTFRVRGDCVSCSIKKQLG